jgi:hypothetical protein
MNQCAAERHAQELGSRYVAGLCNQNLCSLNSFPILATTDATASSDASSSLQRIGLTEDYTPESHFTAVVAASWMICATASGWEIITTCDAPFTTTSFLASARSAMKRVCRRRFPLYRSAT